MRFQTKLYLSLLSCGALAASRITAQTLDISGGQVYFGVNADSPNDVPFPTLITINVIGATSVHFKLTAVNPTAKGPPWLLESII